MKVELNPLEIEYVKAITNGDPSSSLLQLLLEVRRKLLLLGDVQALSKHEVAITVALHGLLRSGSIEPPVSPVQQLVEQVEEQLATKSGDITPVDEITTSEKELLERQNQGLSQEATGGEYRGPRVEWKNEFKSTPRTPISKLEYGRPITYVSPRDGRERAGRFVRVNKGDRTKVNVMSSEMKKAFAVPMQNVRIVDLSPPSTEPRAVQI